MHRSTQILANDPQTGFRRDGHVFPYSVFTELEAARWADEVLALAATGIADHRVPWNQKTYLLLPSLDGLVRDRRLTDQVAALLGEDLLVLSADVFVKQARSTRHITWHQDVNYWALEPFEMLTAWVAFTPATRRNGCMRYASAAHHGRLRHVERPTPENILSRGQELEVAVDETTAVDVTLAPGQVAFHHVLTPHASGPNETDGPRIGFAIRYASTAVRQLAGPPISARLARGSDRHGNFRLESGPDLPLSSSARIEHENALAPHARTNVATV